MSGINDCWNCGAHQPELAAARKVVEAARTQEHEIWCDSLPRGTWVPVGCNCWQSNVWHELKAYDAATGRAADGE